MSDVLVPGDRDVRATLEEPAFDDEENRDGADAIVVACPPHPQHGGSRSDQRLAAASEALLEAGVACLRFDYGPWDEGYGERVDVHNAIRWANERYDRVGVFGYSFGATLALLASADVSAEEPAGVSAEDELSVDAVAALAPTARLADELDALNALDALERVDLPVFVLYGERDTTVEWEPIVEATTERGDEAVGLSSDHFFLGKHDDIGRAVGEFFEQTIVPSS